MTTKFVDLPAVRGFVALAGALLLVAPASAKTVRLTLGSNGTYASAYSENAYLEVPDGTSKTTQTTIAEDGETWWLSAVTEVEGFEFDKWVVTPAGAASDVTFVDQFSPDTEVVIGNAATYIFTANFKRIQHTLTVTSDGNAVSLVPSEGDHTYNLNQVVKLGTPVPVEGYIFDHWAPTNAPSVEHPGVIANYSGTKVTYSVTMDDDYQIMAVFKRELSITQRNYNPTMPDEVIVDKVGEGTKPTVTVPEESILVNAQMRWACNGWSNGGPQIPPNGGMSSYTFVNPIDQDNSLSWTWQKQFCVIGGIANGYGEIAGLNTAVGDNQNWFNDGYELNVSAIPAAGYVFAGWIANPSSILPADAGSSRAISVRVTQGFTLMASFQLLSEDSDGDGMPDKWEQAVGLDPFKSDAFDDPDNDGINNLNEYLIFVDCTNRTGRALYADPLHADSDRDGMDDGWEYKSFGGDSSDELDPTTLVPALLDDGSFAPNNRYGRLGNPDGDFRWDTNTGWEMSNLPLNNWMEYCGPDGEPPYTIEAVAPGATSSDGWRNTYSKTVYRRVTNSADTGDGSKPLIKDSDGDGFDDGFEYSWDKWHQENGGVAPLANQELFPAITDVVEAWDPAGFRPFNPAQPAANGNLDKDYLYGFVDNTPIVKIANEFLDIDEYNASGIATNGNPESANFFPVTRRYVASTGLRWCTNPFVWDTDYDGMADGWEMTFGFDPWFVEPENQLNSDNDYFATDGTLRHKDVYDAYGFDPRTGWGAAPFFDQAQNTAPYTAFQEFIGASYAADCTLDNQADWKSTNPRVHDQDNDGIYDGWELYVDLDPFDDDDAGMHYDVGSTYAVNWVYANTGDNLSNFEEFNSSHTPREGLGGPAYTVPGWFNKTFPTDPWDWDTDSDQLLDGDEKTFFNAGGDQTQTIVTGVDTNGVEITETITIAASSVNGGLCPTSVDTDADNLPDAWEAHYGTMDTAADDGTPTCNGTIADAEDDPDGDGLLNLQEYLLGSVHHWQFQNSGGAAIWDAGRGLGGYDPYDFFDPTAVNPVTGEASNGEFYLGYGGRAPHAWDPHARVRPGVPFLFITGADASPSEVWYSTGDPLDYDTDLDGMDDYWEVFHGLNPLFGTIDVVRSKVSGAEVSGLSSCELDQGNIAIGWTAASDFRLYPWHAGNLFSDSDQDQLSDIDESLQPRVATANLPPNYHTDPSPLWMTDISSEDSFANLYFWSGAVFADPLAPQWFWDENPAPTYFFDFEMNEGFDTDGDFVADRAELVTSDDAPGVTDPLDAMTPIKRRALYLNGDAAARTGPQFGHQPYDLSQFTVDCWVRPENPASGEIQTIVERPALVPQGHHQLPADIPVVNFRIGLDEEGRPFASYNGSQNPLIFTEAKADTFGALEANTWYHLAATYGGSFRADGQWIGKLVLYVNGETVATTTSSEIPFGGWVLGYNESGASDVLVGTAIAMPILVGASDDRPDGRIDGHKVLVGAGAGTYYDPPELKYFFQGWVDQVRIWNDPLTKSEIEYFKDKRFTRADVVQQAKPVDEGGHALLYSYAFDNLPDPDYDPVYAKGFEMLTGRPVSWIESPFWGLAPDRSEWYDDYRVLPWIENQVYHNPRGVPRDQPSADSPTLANGDAFFANTANPYAITYKFGISFAEERHPFLDTWIEDSETMTDTSAISLLPDLLPLRWAAADEDVEMWDNLGTGRNADTQDSDGDGMPDWWEIANGLDYLDATGANGRFGDIDGDGLSNYAEYLAGTDPWASDTDFDGIDDYNSVSSSLTGDQRPVGEQLTDNDFVEDVWEARFDAYYASPVVYDAHLDRDEDGWSNWSEARAHTDPDKAYRLDTEAGIHHGECPAPVINATVRYDGVNKAGSLVVHAFTRPSMDGEPDAVIVGNARHVDSVGIMWFVTELAGTIVVVEDADGFNSEIPSGNGIVPGSVVITDANGTVVHIDNGDGTFGSDATKIDYATGRMRLQSGAFASYSYRVAVEWPMTCTFDTVASGWLREGKNYFFAFLDNDGNGVWNEGEPAGLADGYVHEVGWDSLDLAFTLTDASASFARLHWDRPDGDSLAHEVKITYVGVPVFKTSIRAPRSSVHEGDFIYCEDNGLIPAGSAGTTLASLGVYGLNPGVSSVTPVYEWYLDGVKMGSFTNYYANTLAAPVVDWPKGAIHQYVRPEFRFHLSPEATEFQLQIRKAGTHETVYDARHLVPNRRRDGSDYDMVVWEFPYCVNQDLPSGAIFANGGYQWRVRGFSPHTYQGSAWSNGPDELSNWQEFSMDVQTNAETTYRAAWLQVDVRYYSKAVEDMTGMLRVQAFETASFNDRPAAEVVVDEPGIVTIAGLNPGQYYVRAFIDQDKDYERDVWETWGYVRTSDDADWPFTPKAVEATEAGLSVKTTPVIVMQNCDTDQDGMADSWEYRYNVGKDDWLAVYGVELPASGSATRLLGYTDSDNDGLSDFAEYVAASNPTNPDSDGDGIPDGLEYALGFASVEANALRITSLPGAALSWAWDGEVADTGLGAFAVGGKTAPALGKVVTYVLERATSLTEQDWTIVGSGKSAASIGSLAVPDEDIPNAFYRIRAIVK